MALAAIPEIIGVVSGALGIIQFGIDNFAPSDQGGSVVQIQVGLDSNGGLNNAGGDLPDIRLFNEVGDFLGATFDPGYIQDGTTAKSIRVEQSVEQQATYGLFTAKDDAICIAYLSITWPDDQKFGWTGDWGKECGGSWYYSNVIVGDQKPPCMWIDANGDAGTTTAFQVHFPEFVTTDGQFPHDASYYCDNGPPFVLYTDVGHQDITYWTPATPRTMRNRGISGGHRMQTKSSFSARHTVYSNDTRLIVNNDLSQDVKSLCESAGSRGPDYLNVAEGLFCHMSSKTVYPVCGGSVMDNCFNLDMKKLVVGGVATRDDDYSNVIRWT